MQAQVAGDYSAALRAYAESLKLEEDPLLDLTKSDDASFHEMLITEHESWRQIAKD